MFWARWAISRRKRDRLQHFGLIAIAQNPPGDFVQAGHRHAEIQRAIGQKLRPLGLVPDHFGHIAGHQRLEAN